ncbi:MAG: ABC transporter ATP-binding protein [Myxococcota bacterium]|nr:ABC transporter ATP-binding protein [Myxococcota bacterium]
MNRFKRFWFEFARRYQRWYVLGIVCLIATNALTVTIPTFIQRAIDALDAGEGLTGAGQWALMIIVAGFGVMAVRTLSRTLFFNPGRTIEFRVKSKLFDHLLRQPRRFFSTFTPGDIISRGTNDTSAMRALVGFATLQLFNVAFTLTFSFGRMLQMEATLAVYCLIPLLIGVAIMRLAVALLYRYQAAILAQVALLSERILESYGGHAVLQAYGALPGAWARFDDANQHHLELGERIVLIRNWLMPIVSVLGQLAVVVVLWVGGQRVMNQTMTIGELSAFIAYVTILATGLRLAGFLIGSTQRGYIALGRLFEVLDVEPKRPLADADLDVDRLFEQDVSIRDLTFTYPGSEEPVLRDINLTISHGETIGLFGPTGSGKTTLLSCLARIYEPPAEQIFLGEVDVGRIPIDAFWTGVACVPQDSFLFTRTLRENIAIADFEADISATKVASAVTDAALAEDIKHLKSGLESLVGERGLTLSGGQRQRTALARTLYRDFNLLLLDDVMSAVDHATEKALIQSIYARAKGQTTVLVSHRISVLAQADRIVVLENGRVSDMGHHAELIRKDGAYAKAYRLQQAQDKARAEEAVGEQQP